MPVLCLLLPLGLLARDRSSILHWSFATLQASIYIIMELMDLGSLDTILRHSTRERLSLACVFLSDSANLASAITVPENILAIVCISAMRALEFLRAELRIIHRGNSFISTLLHALTLPREDVKPSNLLINSSGHVKVMHAFTFA